MKAFLMAGLVILGMVATEVVGMSGAAEGVEMREYESGEILFEDPLDGTKVDGWRVAPGHFVEHPEHGTVYLLEPAEGERTTKNPPWVGDENWTWYRVEFEVCTTGENDGWVGPDFHVMDDGFCNNLQVYTTHDRDDVIFESSGRWTEGQLAWKLFPFAQEMARLPKGEWAKVRMDVGDTFANVYVNDATRPCYTVRYLPFARGGIRLWNYVGSGYFRNLRVTALADGEITPVLNDPWTAVIDGDVIRNWIISPLLGEGVGKDDALAEFSSGMWGWLDAPVDVRGIVTVSALGGGVSEKGVVLVGATVLADVAGPRTCRLTYTDQLTMWVNGTEVFRGEPRGWFDPGRSPEDWFGRLIPDQFEVELPLVDGENEVLVRLEVNEPLFGSGFWMRME